MSAPILSVALLGTGLYAQSDYIPALLSKTAQNVRVHTIWSLDEAAANACAAQLDRDGSRPRVLAQKDDIETILQDKDIDAIIMVLPFMYQPDLIRRAWKAGKHVLSEKPIERDVKAGMALVREFEENWASKGLVWRVAEDYDHEPIHKRARALLRDPLLGPVLYWDLQNQNYCPDGDKYQATAWRTIPDYQGGFLLDGGVHSAALLRVILPDTPGSVVSVASLHRRLFPPHDTLQAIVLPEEEAIVDPHGPTTKLKAPSTSAPPQPSGRSVPAGTITMSWALPDLENREPRTHQILTVTCLNGRLTLINDNQTRYLEVFPAAGSGVERVTESSVKLGVEVEIAWFANAIQAKRAGQEVNPEEDYGKPINMCWDVAFIQSMLQSNGTKRSIRETLAEV